MAKSDPYPSEQIEYRFVVDKERAPQVAQALAELALQYDAALITDQPEDVGYRKYMTTEMYEEYPGKIVSVITKDDLRRFAAEQRVTDKVAARTFGLILRELSHRVTLQHANRADFVVQGPLVYKPAGDNVNRPLQEDGLRVETLPALVDELTKAKNVIDGFGPRSVFLMNRLVEELFQPETDPEQ